jgi:hypothetical protein
MLRFDFTSQDYLRDPATALARLRAAGPVVEVRFPIVGRTWITTTSDLAGRIEGKCALEALFKRWPHLELAVAADSIRWRQRPGLRAIERLPVIAGL